MVKACSRNDVSGILPALFASCNFAYSQSDCFRPLWAHHGVCPACLSFNVVMSLQGIKCFSVTLWSQEPFSVCNMQQLYLAGGRKGGSWNLDGSVVELMRGYNQTCSPKYGDCGICICFWCLPYTENGSGIKFLMANRAASMTVGHSYKWTIQLHTCC